MLSYIENKYIGDYLLYCEFKLDDKIHNELDIKLLRPNLYRIISDLDYQELANLIYEHLDEKADLLLFKIENQRVYF